MGTGMEEGYGPYSSSHVEVLVRIESSLIFSRFDMDVDGLINVVRSTEDSEIGPLERCILARTMVFVAE
jgi:hypothetical protein